MSAHEVARLAKVSQASISRAFTPGASISKKMRAKVLEAAEKLNYKPNAIARGLSARRTRIVALVMGDLANPFYIDVLNRLCIALQQAGFQSLLFVLEQGRTVESILPKMFEYQVDAAIVTAATVTSGVASECHRYGLPVILFNRLASAAPAHMVAGHDLVSSRMVADYLYEVGHRRFAYVSGHDNTSTSIERETGFFARMRELGVTGIRREEGNYSYEGGYAAGLRLLDARRRPEAIFCANDYLALGVMDAARFGLGLRIPEDVSIVGFDDIPQASWKTYSLTTLRQPLDQMVQATLRIVEDIEALESSNFVVTRIPGQLVLRGSSLAHRP
ncbi:MAG: LacI family DNA-binding transcriptional regulator [Alphaproteobacteria bacterium]